ncbi:TPA: helix-turn-helix transcriptional regulator [Escherichia coli]|nr:XRE family transcriptional regulator [Salmonella enterica]EDR5491552.1 helix-turn-helix transcriptional regulator [Salmonella enterica subsp. enterica serovar 9,12:-:1,5]EET3371328.1 helix-turn-helix transcriptional regulator [Escherichia coli]EJJ9008125.1 helix-turn-helix transcriptional regulator [Salmonella enterica]EJX5945133.1 helix-turn-helix transcriptional regulator [Salmonella enterica]
MSKETRAERIKKAILNTSTYEDISDKTGISVSTLVRISSGKTEPKFSDIIQIAKVTGVDINEIAYGTVIDIKKDAVVEKNSEDSDVIDAHNFIIWNLSSLDKKDILSMSRLVYALATLKKRRIGK